MAEEQSLGKGRLGRSWHSPFAQNIYLSCRYFFEKNLDSLSGLSLVVALVVTETLKEFLPEEKIKIKWPNDVFFDGKKISGILIDAQAKDNKSLAVIGIGLNVNMDLGDDEIDQHWTSIYKASGDFFDRNEICAKLIKNLLKSLKRFTDFGFVDFIDEWREVDYLFGKMISIKVSEEKKVSGMAKGVDLFGRLLLGSPGEKTRAFSSGEIFGIIDNF